MCPFMCCIIVDVCGDQTFGDATNVFHLRQDSATLVQNIEIRLGSFEEVLVE